MSNVRIRLAREVRNKRQELSMSQERLANEIDKTTSFVGQLERGECSLIVETLQSLVRCLGIDANALLAEDDIPSDKMNELCNIATHLNSKQMNFLIAIARLIQAYDY